MKTVWALFVLLNHLMVQITAEGDCGCSRIEVQSSVPTALRGFAIGTYIQTDTTSWGGKGYPMYQYTSGNDTLMHSKFGWRGFNYHPENPNSANPCIKFKNCKEPCPTTCKNENWTYLDLKQDHHIRDLTLKLICRKDDETVVQWRGWFLIVIAVLAIFILTCGLKRTEIWKFLKTKRQEISVKTTPNDEDRRNSVINSLLLRPEVVKVTIH